MVLPPVLILSGSTNMNSVAFFAIQFESTRGDEMQTEITSFDSRTCFDFARHWYYFNQHRFHFFAFPACRFFLFPTQAFSTNKT